MTIGREIGVPEVHVEQIDDATLENLCTDETLACKECVNLARIKEINIRCEYDSVNMKMLRI